MKQFLFGWFVLLATIPGFGKSSKLSPELSARHDSTPVDVLVQFKSGLTGDADKISSRGGKVKKKLPFIKTIRASLPASRLAELANDSEVAFISPNRQLRTSLNNVSAAVIANYAWGLGLDGTGIGVAVIDSGINSTKDLMNAKSTASRIIYSFDSIGGGTSDLYGHGTHVAGIIAGNAAASTCSSCVAPLRGIASNVNILNFHALDENGQGTDASVISAIDKAIQLKGTYNIRVINLSVGRPVFESYTQDPLCQAVEAAWKAGIVVVVAAGNDGRDTSANGYGTITAPGNDPYVITVGAMNTMGTPDRSDDVMTTYSSKGPTAIDHIVKPDLVAPGNRVISLQAGQKATLVNNYQANRPVVAYYQGGNSGKLSNDYFILSGTSMAAPVVSAAAALLIQQNAALTPDQIKARLMKTAHKSFPRYTTILDSGSIFNIQYDVFTVGAGYLDIQAALSDPSVATLSAQSPTAVYDETTGSVHFVNNSSSIWGSSAMWGSSSVWGSNAFVGNQSAMWGSSALWGSSAMWGSSSTQAFSALWGSSAMWGSTTNTALDATSIIIQGDK